MDALAECRRFLRLVPCLAALLLSSCAQDLAEQEYLAALRGEETGMGREEQLAHIERAIALQPRRAWYRETHAIYSIDERKFEQASADLDTAILLADRPYLRFLRGLVSCQRGAFEASLADFDQAIAKQPANAQFYRGRSLARSRTGRYRDALADATRLIALAPQQGESHYALGVALAGLGRGREAMQAFDESLRRRPELIYPLRARAALHAARGESLLAQADLAEADQKERFGSTCGPCEDPFRY